MSTRACDNPDSWDLWSATPVGNYYTGEVEWRFENRYRTSQCLYDNTQNPAITSGCSATDQLEFFVWEAMPVIPM